MSVIVMFHHLIGSVNTSAFASTNPERADF
jgi:hypothetical protein